MFQQMQIIGRLGKDAEMRYSANGDAITSFSVAVDDGYGDKKKTVWFRCTLWKERAERLTQYLTKGQVVFVEGSLQADDNGGPRIWQKSDGSQGVSFEINVREIKLLPGGPRRDDVPQEEAQQAPASNIPF